MTSMRWSLRSCLKTGRWSSMSTNLSSSRKVYEAAWSWKPKLDSWGGCFWEGWNGDGGIQIANVAFGSTYISPVRIDWVYIDSHRVAPDRLDSPSRIRQHMLQTPTSRAHISQSNPEMWGRRMVFSAPKNQGKPSWTESLCYCWSFIWLLH